MTMAGTMKSLRLKGNDMELCDSPLPEVKASNEVLIKVEVAGVCGTDLHILSGDFPSKQGVTLGHEIVGVVEQMGADCHLFNKGDRVIVNPHGSCGKCYYCGREYPHFCLNKGQDASLGMMRDGGFAKYCLAPEHSCHILPSSITPEQAILVEPYSCILHAVERALPLRGELKIAILGAGIIGILSAIYFSEEDVEDVTVIELNEHRREFLRSMKLPKITLIKSNGI